MDYDSLKNLMASELPLNRKERFYTATVLPALLFHMGTSNFYQFLNQIRNLPKDINEQNTRDKFLFYTEYNLKESAGKKSIGAEIPTSTGDTPDVVIEILKPQKVFVIIEAKMFENLSQPKLDQQMKAQRTAVIEILKGKYMLQDDRVFHVALVPRALGFHETLDYQVLNWEFFRENGSLSIKDNYFYNFLVLALEEYDKLVGYRSGQASTVKGYKTGQEIYLEGKQENKLWVGRKGGKSSLLQDIKEGQWQSREYCFNTEEPLKGQEGNWIRSGEFAALVEGNKEDET